MTNLLPMLRSGKVGALGGAAWIGGALALHGCTPAFFLAAIAFAYGLALARNFASHWSLANVVTSIRLGLVAGVTGALVGQWSAWLWGVSLMALLLDGVDGWTARRRGETSGFGARFDMEVDAAFILVLSLLVWRETDVGAWVVAMGAMRYVFVGASYPFPQLAQPLPPSLARKAVCVLQVAALMAALSPWSSRVPTPTVLALALAALVLSFGRDVAWCLARGTAVPQARLT